jgi:adenylyltransferase/sulfurtransferase
MGMNNINVVDFNEIMQSKQDYYLLDVRSHGEFELTNIGGALIPLDTLEERIEDIPKDKAIYCLCHHGVRSAYAANFLIHSGLTNVYNIDGGIDAWSLQVDSNIPRY